MQTEQDKHKVFVVDDEKTIALTLAAILSHSGFDATYYLDPLEALSLAKANPPQLVISDVVMPGMSGIELAIEITKHCPQCKILLFSGQAQTADLLAQARLQGHDFELLTKPVPPSHLLKAIRQSLS